ncbi:MAG: B12-binding domain-containing radical SAM protein [Flavisolibacter sp.]
MKKMLITHSYFLRYDPKQWKTGQPYAPLGTLLAAALMRESNYDVRFHDVMFTYGPQSIMPSLETNPDFLVIYDDGFNYLTKMCLTNMRHAAFEMIRLGKSRDCTVIVSGSDATDHYEKYISEGADYVLLGEAEMSLLELCNALRDGSEISVIKGLAYRSGTQILKTPGRPVMSDLDLLPLPAWDLVDFTSYKKMWLKSKGYFSVNIGTTRGCPFKCNWCAKPIYGNRYHARSPENVMQELKWLKSLTSFDHVWFCDDIFGLKPGWVNRFAELVQDAGLNFHFKIQSRADLLVQEKYVEALAKAGCSSVWMGAESGSQKILDAMDKGTTIDQIRQATELLKKHKIAPSFFIQFGYLGENAKDIEQTIRMINELMPSEIGISVSYPLPGTKFYEKVKNELTLKANWSDSDELAMMFHQHYQPAFYKQLHRYVHKNFRTQLARHFLIQFWHHPSKLEWKSIRKIITGCWHMPSAFLLKRKLKKLQHS